MIKVLVVEDEEIIRKGFIHTIDWLEMDCQIIDEACNGEEGLEKILTYRPELVITDIMMPKMNGIEMVEKARQVYPFKSIFLTSYQEFEYAKKAIQLQVFDYLLKPVDEEALSQTIQKVKQAIKEQKVLGEIREKSRDKGHIKLIDVDIYLSKDEGYNYYIAESMRMIQTHYNTKISVELLAEQFQVSTSYLSRKFKESTNQTFLEILHKYRIQKATELLQEGNYRIGEVAERVGFNEYKHFCHVFKKYIGMAPTEFMKNTSILVANKG